MHSINGLIAEFFKSLLVNVLLCMFSVFSNLNAATYYVNNATTVGDIYTTAIGSDLNPGISPASPKATVSDVIADYVLGPNDIIYVDAGTYNESFSFTSADQGTAAGHIKVIGAGSALTIFNSVGAANNLDVINADYIWIEKINFVNSTANEHNIELHYGTYFNVRNCKLDITSTTSSSSINVYFRCNTNTSIDGNYANISNNTINSSSSAGRGVRFLGDADFATISGNTITMTGADAFGMSFEHFDAGLDDYWPINNTISNNTISSPKRGINIISAETSDKIVDYVISGNRINLTANIDADNSCIRMFNCGEGSSNDMKIIGNRLSGGYAGIYINHYCEFIKVYNNYICNVRFGLYNNNYDNFSPENELYHNSFYTSGSCLFFDNDSQDDWNIRNNIFFTTASSPSACINMANVPGFGEELEECNYNLFWAPNGARIGVVNVTTVHTTLVSWQSADYCVSGSNDPNSMNKLPAYQAPASCDLDLFKDVANYPYPGQPWDGYPQGTNLTAIVGVDIYGTTRTEPTIGAFEYTSPLPVTLLSFDVLLRNRMVELNWVTASEKNNDYFIIERSDDGVIWEFLDKLGGAGNSNQLLSYQTYDFNPYRGITYYRLKQVDFDGQKSYSEIRSVFNTADLTVLQNPSNGIFGVGGMPKHQENVIRVMDLSGKQLQEHLVFGESFELDLTDYHAGMYLVTVNEMETIKIIKE